VTRQISTFVLGNTLLGLDILLVKEVYRSVSITPIPDAPDHIRGLLNLRGRVVTVMDLDICLRRQNKIKKEENYLLILKTDDEIKGYQKKGNLVGVSLGDDIAGFLIDQMDDVIEIEADEVVPPPPNLEEVEGELVEGIIKKGNRLVILLDITKVLESVMAVMESEKLLI
jgi:purine-binding chemotaxis protein CheW